MPESAATISFPVGPVRTRRAYIKHRQRTVLFLERHYHVYTLKELEALLGIPWRKIKKLAERNHIRKRAPNRPRSKKGHIPPVQLALF